MGDTQGHKASTPAEVFVSEAERTPSCNTEESKSSNALAISAEIAKELENKSKKAGIKLKWLYGVCILVVLGFWEWFVIDTIQSQVDMVVPQMYHLSDAVLIALLTSATANILTLPAIILRYLFPRKK